MDPWALQGLFFLVSGCLKKQLIFEDVWGRRKVCQKSRKNPTFERPNCARYLDSVGLAECAGIPGELRRGLKPLWVRRNDTSRFREEIRHAVKGGRRIQSASAHSAGPGFYYCWFVGLWICLFGGVGRKKTWKMKKASPKVVEKGAKMEPKRCRISMG